MRRAAGGSREQRKQGREKCHVSPGVTQEGDQLDPGLREGGMGESVRWMESDSHNDGDAQKAQIRSGGRADWGLLIVCCPSVTGRPYVTCGEVWKHMNRAGRHLPFLLRKEETN